MSKLNTTIQRNGFNCKLYMYLKLYNEANIHTLNFPPKVNRRQITSRHSISCCVPVHKINVFKVVYDFENKVTQHR